MERLRKISALVAGSVAVALVLTALFLTYIVFTWPASFTALTGNKLEDMVFFTLPFVFSAIALGVFAHRWYYNICLEGYDHYTDKAKIAFNVGIICLSIGILSGSIILTSVLTSATQEALYEMEHPTIQ